jgi:glycerol kinase
MSTASAAPAAPAAIRLIGAIDQGTSSSRFILFDRSGRAVHSHQTETEFVYPKPGYACAVCVM